MMKKSNKYKIVQELEAEHIKARYRDLGLPENFCPVPFTTIIAEPDGKIGSCRLKGSGFSIGDIREKSMEEIWNDEFIRKWRREFLTGKVEICAREIKHRGCNLCSENNKLLDFTDFSEFQKKPIVKFTANFNGFCNLRCQTCHIWQMPNGLYDKINFWEKAEKDIFPYIREIDFLSGEPFLQSDTFRLIDMIVPMNPDCRWLFTTNAHYKLENKLEDYLDRLVIKGIMISIDSFEPGNFSKIRKNGNLDQVLETTSAINNYRNSREKRGLERFPIQLGFLFQKDNWHELGSALDYCEKMNFRPHIQYCYEPVEYSVLDFDIEKQKEILYWYLNNLSWEHIEMGIRAITPTLYKLEEIDRADFLMRLRKKKLAEAKDD
ncbi:MAG: radical SAM protein [Bacteriovoracaceae bacterium]|nr:radical SAM protein [Bacteriovoracaceae bacterium]